MNNYGEIDLASIAVSGKNPRKYFDKKKLEELAESIRQKGVIEPIIVRASTAPLKKGQVQYEIVAGERRWKAAAMAGLAKIPCLVRDLSDEEAYDFMLIENLQRDDLTDREEAESFKAYVKAHGEGAEAALAEKTGIPPGYIRSRIRVLELPAKVLKAWDEGKLVFGHLQQLLRISDEKERMEMVSWVFQRMQWHQGSLSVKELESQVAEHSPVLSGAFFKTSEVCAACPSNSAVQRELFDIDTKHTRCLNPACFKKNQVDWLALHWPETAIAKREHTKDVRIREEYGAEHERPFGGWRNLKPGKKCTGCPDFVSVIELGGKVLHGQACAGKSECFTTITEPKSAKEKETGERDPEAPRAKWHGEYFRDVFFCKRIPEALAKLDPDDPKVKDLLLVCAIHGSQSEFGHHGEPAAILAKKPCDRTESFKTVAEKIILTGKDNHLGGPWRGRPRGQFGTKGRRLVGEFLGIKLEKEFAVDKDYLDKKTRAECLAFIKKFGIQSDPKFKAFMEKKHKRQADKLDGLKKSEVVAAILESGVPLTGKVPAEILARKS